MLVSFACAPENQHVIFYVFLGPVLKGASDYTTENGPAAAGQLESLGTMMSAGWRAESSEEMARNVLILIGSEAELIRIGFVDV